MTHWEMEHRIIFYFCDQIIASFILPLHGNVPSSDSFSVAWRLFHLPSACISIFIGMLHSLCIQCNGVEIPASLPPPLSHTWELYKWLVFSNY